MSLQAMLDRIRKAAVKEGGAFIPYSQCVEPTRTLIKMMPQTNGGICKALSAKWVAEHANGRSLFTWLCTPGTTNVRQAAIAELMINFMDGTQKSGSLANQSVGDSMKQEFSTSGLSYQTFMTDKYLQTYGLKRRTGLRGYTGSMTNLASVGANAVDLANLFDSRWMNTKGESYMTIGILGKRGGHAIAGYVAGEEVIVFDPNFGEFYFPSINGGWRWFQFFYQTSNYIKDFPNFYVLGYAKDATGNWSKYK